jgi:hypothetical protein
MAGTDTGQCANGACGQPLSPGGTGRPGRYCSAACRQAAYRARSVTARAEAKRAAELADAQAARSALWPGIESAADDVGEIATAIVSYAAVELPEDRGALAHKLGELRAAVDHLEWLATTFRRADERAAELGGSQAAAMTPAG